MTKMQTEEPRTVSWAVHAGPEWRELFLLLAVSFVVFWTSAFLLHKSTDFVGHYGDNAAYMDVADAILHWDFHDLQVQHFMGYPYLIAVVSLLFRVPTGVALWVIAVAGCVASVWLTARLFGTTAAGYFAFTHFAWLQVSYLGRIRTPGPCDGAWFAAGISAGSDCGFGAAGIVGGHGSTVDVLCAGGNWAGIALPEKIRAISGHAGNRAGDWHSLCIAISPLFRRSVADSAQLHLARLRRGESGWARGHLFGWPFHGIVVGTLTYPAPWTNLVLSFFWIALVLLGVGMMFSSNFRKYAKSYPNEAIFCGFYLFAIFSDDYLIWARSNFIRFCIPTLPFVFFCIVASFAEGPQGDLGPLPVECGGGGFGS